MRRPWSSRRKRRPAGLTLAIAALVLASARLSGGEEPLETELVVVTTGGAFEQALKERFYEPFAKATGVVVRTVAASSSEQWARLKAMSQAGKVEWDIVDGANPEAYRELLARVDCQAIPNAAAQGVPGTCRETGLLRTIGGTVLAYSTRAFPAGRLPRSWADFWDVQKFPGPRAVMNAGTPWQVLMIALMADGVPPDRLFPLDLDRAFRKLDQLKPYVKVWWKTGDQSQQIMRDGETVMSIMWSGRALSLKAAGVPVDLEWGRGVKSVAQWSVVKGMPHPKAALAFLNFFMGRPEAHLAFARQMFYDTSNRLALDLLPPAEREKRATFPANWNSMADIDEAWVGEHQARIIERWNAWLAR